MRVEMNFNDKILSQFQTRLREFGESGPGSARAILRSAINTVGKKAFAQVKDDLKAKGVDAQTISRELSNKRASENLIYTIQGKGRDNLRLFSPFGPPRGSGQLFQASPFGQPVDFPKTFQPGLPRGSDPSATVFTRIGEGSDRRIKPAMGPSIVAEDMLQEPIPENFKHISHEVFAEVEKLIDERMNRTGHFLLPSESD